jgi:dihydroxyacetone kinase-like protein
MERFADKIEERCDELTLLDAAIGDADHGVNMRRGMRAVLADLDQPAAVPSEVFDRVGRTLTLTVGGAGGPLYGTAFRSMAQAVPDREALLPAELHLALAAALAGVQRLGAAVEGDKTMVDAFAPGVRALRQTLERDLPLAEAVAEARQAAEEGMLATIPLRALKGRASYLGARSEGHQDPGATSTALVFVALEEALQA